MVSSIRKKITKSDAQAVTVKTGVLYSAEHPHGKIVELPVKDKHPRTNEQLDTE